MRLRCTVCSWPLSVQVQIDIPVYQLPFGTIDHLKKQSVFFIFVDSHQNHREPRPTDFVNWQCYRCPVEQRKPAERSNEHRERDHSHKLRTVAAHDRSTTTRSQMDKDQRRRGTTSCQTGTERVTIIFLEIGSLGNRSIWATDNKTEVIIRHVVSCLSSLISA